MIKAAKLMRQRQVELAQMEAIETGKPSMKQVHSIFLFQSGLLNILRTLQKKSREMLSLSEISTIGISTLLLTNLMELQQ